MEVIQTNQTGTTDDENERLFGNNQTRTTDETTIQDENEILFGNYRTQDPTMRTAIAFYYRHVLKAPPKVEWDGRDGTISIIQRELKIESSKRRTIKSVLDKLDECINKKIKFSPTGIYQSLGPKIIIKEGSYEECIIADWMEQGLGFRMTTLMVNQHRLEEDLLPVGRNCVMNAFYRMKPLVTKLKKMPQGNINNEEWMLARKNQCRQMMVMLGLIGKKDLQNIYEKGIPPWFDATKLPNLNAQQIVWWDEMHLKQEGGMVTTDGYQIRFARDENGKYDPNGSFAEEMKKPTFKFEQEARFCLGVASVKEDGKVVGKKCKCFDYTSKKIVSIKDMNKYRKDEIERVKNLKCNNAKSPWIVNNRPSNSVLYSDDDLSMIKGIGNETKKLLKKHKIKCVGDLKAITKKQIKSIDLPGLPDFISAAKKCKNECCPYKVINYKTKANPYQAKYGDKWKDEIDKCVALSPYVCVTSMIDHIIKESQKIMDGTVYEKSWYFYHDALSLMTSKQSRDWMEKQRMGNKSFLERWLLPMNGMNKGTRYEHMPVGNSPEFNPLDNSLNRDLQVCNDYHCVVTAHLNDEDDRKFSKKTPNKISRGIKRIWDSDLPNSVPSSKRINEDVWKALDSMRTVEEEQGKIVPNLVARTGHRYRKEGKKGGHGGKRVKRLQMVEERWLHPLAAEVKRQREEENRERFMLG